jgi:hypothetical protein
MNDFLTAWDDGFSSLYPRKFTAYLLPALSPPVSTNARADEITMKDERASAAFFFLQEKKKATKVYHHLEEKREHLDRLFPQA